MEYLFICYKRCSTCAKAKKFLEDNNLIPGYVILAYIRELKFMERP